MISYFKKDYVSIEFGPCLKFKNDGLCTKQMILCCKRFHDTSQEEFAFGQGKAVGKTTGLTSSAVLPDYPMVVVMGTAQLTDHFGVSGVECDILMISYWFSIDSILQY